MPHLPVIIGFGGINAAGRSSFHHGYRRLILDKLDAHTRQQTILDLITLTNHATYQQGQYTLNNQTSRISPKKLVSQLGQSVLNDTLIRRIVDRAYNVDALVMNKAATLQPDQGQSQTIRLKRRQVPNCIPSHWQVEDTGGDELRITIHGGIDAILPDYRQASVQAAGQLPSGFNPGDLYQSRNHPRSLQMTVFSASDAIYSTGIDWSDIRALLPPDQVAVYAGNSIGQLDEQGFGGLIKNPSVGKRITSKQMPLGYGQMPADFINAYLIGSLGATGSSLGACATFLYNLHNGVNDIKDGKRQLVIVGSSDAPITPEVIEGFRTMGALAEDHDLCALDHSDKPDYRRAVRPFSSNCGFTIGESSQFVVLCSDALALQLGAQIHGSVPDVFINADGHKKSISAPGIGNYITLGKALALAEKLIGTSSLQQRTCVQAHGTSTPQNRVTESHVLNESARAFGIENWPVAAIKCYLGHSQGTAGGDQLNNSLGIWQYGYIPGINTIDHVADDVHTSQLRIQAQHHEVGTKGIDAVLLNSKGFGGNNASAILLSPHITTTMLTRKHGLYSMNQLQSQQEATLERAQSYNEQAIQGQTKPIYQFGKDVLTGEDLAISHDEIRIPGYDQPISLNVPNPYTDYGA